jgi:probable HAF family extracellular repeat protein
MRSTLHSLPRRVAAMALATLATWPALASTTFEASIIAAPQRFNDVEMSWFTARDLNNSGKSLVHGMGVYHGDSYHIYNQQGEAVAQVGGSGRYGGTVRHAINNLGDVVGTTVHSGSIMAGDVRRGRGFEATIHGFADDFTGGFFSDTYAYGLSDAGHVVGQAEGSRDGRQRAYVWRDQVMEEIGTFGGATSTARAVNDLGEAVGHADLADGRVHAFRYSAGRLTDLGTFGGANSWAYDINARGQVVGTAEHADGGTRAFIHSRGQLRALPTPDGANAGAWSINRLGEAVGSYTLAGQSHPFYFDGRAVHRLQDLLSAADQAVWTIKAVAAINDKGWVLVDADRAGDAHSSVLLLKPQR